ncbi:MAG TPA: GNAT family N-acetyltransferase [Gaiellales bacterium]
MRSPLPADAAVAAALANAYGRSAGGDTARSEADIRDDWRGLGDAERDAWIVERDGVPAGYGYLHEDGHERLFALGWVEPDHAGHGVGAALVEAIERRARELAAVAGAAAITVRTDVLLADLAAGALLAARGYARADQHVRMVAVLDGPPPVPDWPADVVAGGFDPGRDGAEVDACVVEAFDNGWSSQARWRERKVTDPRFDPALWTVARAGREVCGVALCTPETFGMGFIESLAVRTPWRRRGLGAALLSESLSRFWERGERRVGLGVDGDNSGARRLYERGGMRVAWLADNYEKVVRA